MKTNIRNILFCALLAIGLGVPYLQAADVAISALPAGTTLVGNEYIPAVQSGATVKIQPAAIATYLLSGSATTEVLANNAGAFDGDSGFTFNATNNTVNLGGATLTASDPVLDLSQTWNSGATTFTGLKFNVTDTASAAASELLALQVGGTNKVRIDKDGYQYSTGYFGTTLFSGVVPGGTTLQLRAQNTTMMTLTGTGTPTTIVMPTGAVFGYTNTYLAYDAANVFAQRNGVNAQTLRVYDTYTDSSNYGRLALNTSLTGDWVQVAAETAGTGGDNYGIALTPTGTGAISAHVPDSTAAGGNARGANAVDWQTSRLGATAVASAQESVIAGGSGNVGAGQQSFIGGGAGNSTSALRTTIAGGSSNTASGTNASVGGGASNTASGAYSWVPGGNQSTTRGLAGAGAYSSGQRSAVGDAQVILQPIRRTTTDATPVSLATDGTPAATTVMVLPASSMMACEALVGMKYGSDSAGYKLLAVFERDGSNNTSLVGSVTQTVIAEDAGLSGSDATFVANDTLESAQVQVTGPAGTAYSVAEVKCVQVL